MTARVLDLLQARFPGCDALAFADLSTQMVLVTDSANTLVQERRDALCAEARLVFAPQVIGTHPAQVAIIATDAQLRIYLRSRHHPQEALCSICAPHVPLAEFLAAARICLDQISNADDPS